MDDEQRNELTRVSVYLNLDEALFLRDYLQNVLDEVDPAGQGEHNHVTDGPRELTVWIMQSAEEERAIAAWYAGGLEPGG
jgi:hypothetical protein